MNTQPSQATWPPDIQDAALKARTRALHERIMTVIKASGEGVIGFDEYMSLALYEPELGYYAGPNTIFGSDGDFVTAAESGDLFASCIARVCAPVLTGGAGKVIEFGGGSGQFAADLVTHLATSANFAEGCYEIVERSASLKQRQQNKLRDVAHAPRWRFSWADTPTAVDGGGVVIANEVVDAFPARRFQKTDTGTVELGVASSADQLVWQPRLHADVPPEMEHHFADKPVGYSSESIVGIEAWLSLLRGTLKRGLVLITDYGYSASEFFHPARSQGTLQCHYRHHVHDNPLILPGLQDMTTSVNFTALAEVADSLGFDVAGYATQTKFLLNSGIEDVLNDATADAVTVYNRAQQAKRLLLPGEMGQNFKVMALTLDYDQAVTGFQNDDRHRLADFADKPLP